MKRFALIPLLLFGAAACGQTAGLETKTASVPTQDTTTTMEQTTTTMAPTTTTTVAPTTTTTLPPTTTTTLAPTHTITGTFKVFDIQGGVATTGSSCYGTKGYDDISPGTQVVIKDGSGDILATTQLGVGTGKTVNDLFPGKYPEMATRLTQCNFSWKAPQVPDAAFYQIEVSDRGVLTFSKAELTAQSWKVASSLGPAL